MYRPANTVPYATVEADLPGNYQKYSVLDDSGGLATRSGSEAEQKCCALQHWIFQWTNGSLLLTRLEGTRRDTLSPTGMLVYPEFVAKVLNDVKTEATFFFVLTPGSSQVCVQVSGVLN